MCRGLGEPLLRAGLGKADGTVGVTDQLEEFEGSNIVLVPVRHARTAAASVAYCGIRSHVMHYFLAVEHLPH
jgi:hypothetical protein